MPQDEVIGICWLCLQLRSLKNSHIWSAFLYRDYVADMAKGGQVVGIFEGDREEGRQEGRQVTRKWLCYDCEQTLSESERKIATLLRTMERRPGLPQQYDQHLLRFATSISWRVLHFLCEQYNRQLIEDEYPACKYWRHYLNWKRPDVAGFTQHVFVLFDNKKGMHKILSGSFGKGFKMIVAQAGPLLIVGRVTSHFADNADAAIWKRSEIDGASGHLEALKEWRVGGNITVELFETLLNLENRMVKAVKVYYGVPPYNLHRKPRRRR